MWTKQTIFFFFHYIISIILQARTNQRAPRSSCLEIKVQSQHANMDLQFTCKRSVGAKFFLLPFSRILKSKQQGLGGNSDSLSSNFENAEVSEVQKHKFWPTKPFNRSVNIYCRFVAIVQHLHFEQLGAFMPIKLQIKMYKNKDNFGSIMKLFETKT